MNLWTRRVNTFKEEALQLLNIHWIKTPNNLHPVHKIHNTTKNNNSLMGSSSSKEKTSNPKGQTNDPTTQVPANNDENTNQTLVPKGFETLTSRAEEGRIISETIKQEEIKVKGNLDALISELNQMEQENPDPRTEEIAKQIEALKHYIKLQMETLGKIKGRRYQVICRNGLNSLIAAERVAEDFEKESGRDYCCGGGHGHTDRNSSFIYPRNQLNLNIDKDININVPA